MPQFILQDSFLVETAPKLLAAMLSSENYSQVSEHDLVILAVRLAGELQTEIEKQLSF